MEGDRLHPPANVEKMRQGVPLPDADQAQWLDRIGEELEPGRRPDRCDLLALKGAYRESGQTRASSI
jgi:gluconokinase